MSIVQTPDVIHCILNWNLNFFIICFFKLYSILEKNYYYWAEKQHARSVALYCNFLQQQFLDTVEIAILWKARDAYIKLWSYNISLL